MRTFDELTLDDIDALEPGVETDWLVAQLMPTTDEEGYGLAHGVTGQPLVVHKLALGRPCGDFCPSADANDAVRVLETMDYYLAEYYHENREWRIANCAQEQWDASFCMAVCKAFLMHKRGAADDMRQV